LAAKTLDRRNVILGSCAAVLGVITATAIFSNITDSPSQPIQVIAGALVLLAVSLSVAQTFLNYPAAANAHRSAAAGYGRLRRMLEQESLDGEVDDAVLGTIRADWNALDRESPAIPARIHDRVLSQVVGPSARTRSRRWYMKDARNGKGEPT